MFRIFICISITIVIKINSNFSAHLERGEENVWIFDWSKLSFYDYESAVKNSKIIAQIFAIALTKLVNLGFNIDNCHLVAHSLGAQIAGLIWKYMAYTLHKITGNFIFAYFDYSELINSIIKLYLLYLIMIILSL